MAKRATATTRKKGKKPDTIEQRVVAFAEHLGRIAGTVQARAERLTRTPAATKKSATAKRSTKVRGAKSGASRRRGRG